MLHPEPRSGLWWHGYSAIAPDGAWKGSHGLMIAGPSPVIPADLEPAAEPWTYVGSWDHPPTEAEKLAVTPAEFR